MARSGGGKREGGAAVVSAQRGKTWLTFFGRPSLVRGRRVLPLELRYRKGCALLAFLSSQPSRTTRRGALADLLWPDLAEAEGRRNLRVVLNDLAQAMSGAGFDGALEIGRDWVTFRCHAGLLTDEMLLRALAGGEAADFSPLASKLTESPWCDLGGRGAEEGDDWHAWLSTRREALERLRQEWLRRAGKIAAGAKLSPAPGAPPPDPEPAALEWMHLALLRVEFDPPAAVHADERQGYAGLNRLVETLEQECRYFGGRLAATDATGATFAFGAASLHAGYRWMALRAAAALSSSMPASTAARMGLCAGGVLVECAPDGLIEVRGARVKLVERIALAADEGSLAADESFADLAPQLGLAPMGTRCFRGFNRESMLYGRRLSEWTLPELPPLQDRASFVGRDAEMMRLDAAAQEAEQGARRVLVLEGRPGIGKTRLIREFALRLRARGVDVHWFSCRAETAGQPWAALYEWLTRRLPGHAGSMAERLDDLAATRQAMLSPAEKDVLRHFLERRFVAQADHGALARACLKLMEGGGLVVIDDAHWLDGASARLLAMVLGQLPAALVVLTRRPQATEGFSLPGAQTLTMEPLDEAAAERLLHDLLGPEADASVRRSRLVQARGVPLFLVAGCAGREGDSATGELFTFLCNRVRFAVPALGAAALLGMQFRLSDLERLVGLDGAREALEQAAREHLVVGYDPDNWAFFHPLAREALLDALAPEQRAALAARAAALFMRRGETVRAAALFETAGQPDAARDAWLAGANAALDAEDALAACELFGHVERLGYPPGAEGLWARVRHARARIVHEGYGTPPTSRLCGEVLDLLPGYATDDAPEIAFHALALLYLWSGGADQESGLAYAARLAQAASDDPVKRLTADWAHGNTLMWLGRFDEARRYFEIVLDACPRFSLAERTRYFTSDPWVFASTTYALLLWFVGEEGWRARIETFVAQACASPLKQDACVALFFEAAIRMSAGEDERFAAAAAAAHDIALAEGFIFWEVLSGLEVAVAHARTGRAIDPAALMQAEAAVTQAYPAGINSARWLMAEALVAAGMIPEALDVIGRALEDAHRCEHAYCLPDIWRLKARAHEALGADHAARQASLRAHEMARQMGAYGWIARWREVLTGR